MREAGRGARRTESAERAPEELAGESAAEAQARAERLVAAMLARDAFTAWLGAELVAVAPDACTLRMAVREEMLNGFGVCHGGITFSLADSALAFASNTHGRVTMSVDTSITYPAAARRGDTLTAIAEREGGSNRLAFYRVTVRSQEGATVALFRGTVYRTSTELLPAGTPSGG